MSTKADLATVFATVDLAGEGPRFNVTAFMRLASGDYVQLGTLAEAPRIDMLRWLVDRVKEAAEAATSVELAIARKDGIPRPVSKKLVDEIIAGGKGPEDLLLH